MEYNKHMDAQLPVSGQKEIEGLIENNPFKVHSPGIVIKPEEITSSI